MGGHQERKRWHPLIKTPMPLRKSSAAVVQNFIFEQLPLPVLSNRPYRDDDCPASVGSRRRIGDCGVVPAWPAPAGYYCEAVSRGDLHCRPSRTRVRAPGIVRRAQRCALAVRSFAMHKHFFPNKKEARWPLAPDPDQSIGDDRHLTTANRARWVLIPLPAQDPNACHKTPPSSDRDSFTVAMRLPRCNRRSRLDSARIKPA